MNQTKAKLHSHSHTKSKLRSGLKLKAKGESKEESVDLWWHSIKVCNQNLQFSAGQEIKKSSSTSTSTYSMPNATKTGCRPTRSKWPASPSCSENQLEKYRQLHNREMCLKLVRKSELKLYYLFNWYANIVSRCAPKHTQHSKWRLQVSITERAIRLTINELATRTCCFVLGVLFITVILFIKT